jgi:hypothetical protein
MAATAACRFGTSTRSSAAPTAATAGAAARVRRGRRNLNTLIDFRYARRHEAGRGEHGMGSDMFGAAATTSRCDAGGHHHQRRRDRRGAVRAADPGEKI